MELWILFGIFTLLMLIGTPIAFCLGVASFATVLYMGLPPLVVFQRLNSGMSVFSLLAIPFFIYAGDLMVRGGIASRIVAFAGSLVGHVRGGLGQVNIATATLFGGISCLDCHRNPEKYVRPREAVFQMDYEAPANQIELGRRLVKEYDIQSLMSCSTCHR